MADLVTPSRGHGLVDILDRVLDKGLVIAGDIKINLANVELLTIQVRLLVCSIDKAEQIGLNWWRHDPRSDVQRRRARFLPATSSGGCERIERSSSSSPRTIAVATDVAAQAVSTLSPHGVRLTMAVERSPSGSSLIDVLDRVLDKGIVIDAWVRVSLVGIDLVTVEARIVVASIDTYLKYSEAVGITAPVSRPRELGAGHGLGARARAARERRAAAPARAAHA